MYKKLILLFILLTTQLFAVDEWWVYSYGNVSTIKDVLTYLAIFKNSADYQDLILIALLGGGLISVTLKYTLGSAGYTKYFVGSTFLLMVIFGTTTSVNTVNARIYEGTIPTGNNYARVDNVPLMFATTVSAFSTIGYFFTSNIEDTFSAVGDAYASDRVATSFLKVGFNGAFKMFNEISSTDLATISTNAQSMIDNYKAYMELCVFPIAYTYNPSAVERLLKYSQDISSDINPATSPLNDIVSISNIQVEHEGSVETCGDLYTAFEADFTALNTNNTDIVDFFNKTLANMANNPSDKLGSVVSMFMGTNGSDNASKLKNYVLNTALIKQTAFSFNAYTDEVNGGTTSVSGGAGVFGSSLSKGEFIAKSTTNSQFAAETLPSMQEVIRAFMYVAFPIVLIIQLVSGGIKILQNYVMALLWVELWPPAFTIMNYFVQKETTYEAIDKLAAAASDTGIDNLVAIATIDPALETIAVNSAIASNWFWMVPMLTGFLIYGSFHALMGLTGAVASNAARGADLSYQQEKQQLQSSYEAAKNSGETNALGAESMAYQNSLASRVESDAKTQGMISEFNGSINSIAGTANKLGAADASRNKGYADHANTTNSYSAGQEKALNELSTNSKLEAIKTTSPNSIESVFSQAGKNTGVDLAAQSDTSSLQTSGERYNMNTALNTKDLADNSSLANTLRNASSLYGAGDDNQSMYDLYSQVSSQTTDKKIAGEIGESIALSKLDTTEKVAQSEAQANETIGKTNAAMNYANKHFGGDVAAMNQFNQEYALAKTTGNNARMQQLADQNFNGDVTAMHFNTSGQNFVMEKNGKVFTNSYDTEGNVVKSSATWNDNKGTHKVEYDSEGNRVNVLRNNDTILSKQLVKDNTVEVKDVRGDTLRKKWEDEGLNLSEQLDEAEKRSFGNQLNLSLNGLKDVLNDIDSYFGVSAKLK